MNDNIENKKIALSKKERALSKSEENIKTINAIIDETMDFKDLKKMEEVIGLDPNYEFKSFVAMYVYYVESDKVSKTKFPNLFRIMNEFVDSINKGENDPYLDSYEIFEYRREKKHNSEEFMKEAKFYINKIIDENDLTIEQVSEVSDIDFQTLFNFLKTDKENNEINYKKIHKVLWFSWGIKENWSSEKTQEIHLKKYKNLWLHWNVDVDTKNIKDKKKKNK